MPHIGRAYTCPRVPARLYICCTTQMLLRSLARGEHAVWFDSLVLLVAPIYNAGGNERADAKTYPILCGK